MRRPIQRPARQAACPGLIIILISDTLYANRCHAKRLVMRGVFSINESGDLIFDRSH